MQTGSSTAQRWPQPIFFGIFARLIEGRRIITQSHVKNIAVIGAGTMGAGIAQLAAMRGTNVRLIDERYELPIDRWPVGNGHPKHATLFCLDGPRSLLFTY